MAALFARGAMERSARRLTDEPWKAVFAGLLTQLLFFPVLLFVTVILAVSIIGIPLLVLVPVAVLALLVAMLVGFTAVAQSLGRWVGQRFGWTLAEPFVPVLVGLAILQGVTIVARILGLPGGILGLFAFALIAFGFFIKFVAWTMGLGAMTLSLLGRDWRRPSPDPEPLLRGSRVEEEPFSPPPPPAPPAADAPDERVSTADEAASDTPGTAVTEVKDEPAERDGEERKA
jgi:hypothetical protein